MASCGSDDTYNNLSGWNGTGSFEARWREMACFPGGFWKGVPKTWGHAQQLSSRPWKVASLPPVHRRPPHSTLRNHPGTSLAGVQETCSEIQGSTSFTGIVWCRPLFSSNITFGAWGGGGAYNLKTFPPGLQSKTACQPTDKPSSGFVSMEGKERLRLA